MCKKGCLQRLLVGAARFRSRLAPFPLLFIPSAVPAVRFQSRVWFQSQNAHRGKAPPLLPKGRFVTATCEKTCRVQMPLLLDRLANQRSAGTFHLPLTQSSVTVLAAASGRSETASEGVTKAIKTSSLALENQLTFTPPGLPARILKAASSSRLLMSKSSSVRFTLPFCVCGKSSRYI